jgi:hypothetical protein
MFRRIRINSWSEISTLLDSLTLWAFRGHRDSTWELESSLFLAGKEAGCNPGILHNREDWMLYQFKRRAHHYLERLPADDSTIEWLALMQHHGAPTRLVDFTYSFYVACHFAFIEPKNDVSIWAISIQYLWDKLAARLKCEPDQWRIHEYRKESLIAAERVIKSDSTSSGLFLIEPDTLSQRESIQQGLFVMPETLSKCFLRDYKVDTTRLWCMLSA